jgi:hypothetical protein
MKQVCVLETSSANTAANRFGLMADFHAQRSICRACLTGSVIFRFPEFCRFKAWRTIPHETPFTSQLQSEPQTSSATSTTWRSFAISSASVTGLPW